MSSMLELALFDQLLPNGLRELVGRGDRDDVGLAAAGHGIAANLRFGMQMLELEPRLERLEGRLQLLRRRRAGRLRRLGFGHCRHLLNSGGVDRPTWMACPDHRGEGRPKRQASALRTPRFFAFPIDY